MPTEERRFDTVVVGSGPGGATVARELAREGRRVMILERGGDAAVTGSLLQAVRELGMPGRNLLVTNGFVGIVRATRVGGCSVYYYATATDPPYEAFARRGIDLHPHVDRVRDELPTAPLRDDLVGPKATRIMASARDLGMDWRPLPKFIFQDRCPAGEWLGFYEAPTYESKWNARMWVHEAVALGAELVTGARVERVLVEGGSATGVEYATRAGRRRAHADTVVLAAGGLGTPVVLRASGVAAAGRDFFFDPMIAVMGEIGEGESTPEIPMATGMLLEEDGYMITDMTVPAPLYGALSAQVGRIDRLGAHSRTLQIMVKVRDDLGGRLTDRGGVRKALTDADRARFRHGFGRAREILTHAGARHVYRSGYIASHPGGTAKVGEVVDADLQTEYENLYVCDCSVMPEPWGRPPPPTLLALGKRLAAHIVRGGKQAPTREPPRLDRVPPEAVPGGRSRP